MLRLLSRSPETTLIGAARKEIQCRHDGGWTLIEIERPQDKIFTTSDDFTSRFTHAFGQVLDFQQWVDQNVAYAQELLPPSRLHEAFSWSVCGKRFRHGKRRSSSSSPRTPAASRL